MVDIEWSKETVFTRSCSTLIFGVRQSQNHGARIAKSRCYCQSLGEHASGRLKQMFRSECLNKVNFCILTTAMSLNTGPIEHLNPNKCAKYTHNLIYEHWRGGLWCLPTRTVRRCKTKPKQKMGYHSGNYTISGLFI